MSDGNGDGETGGYPRGDEPTVEVPYWKVFRHSNDAIMIVDLEAETFLDVNPAACELLGYSREELLSMSAGDIHPEDIDRVREEFIRQVSEVGSGFTSELVCLTKDGREVPTEASGAALDPPDEGGTPRRMIAMLRDVSARVEHQRALEERIERLDQFAGIVSHDLRSPLSTIRGHAELGRETGDVEHFDAIVDATARMEEMLSELLQLTRSGEVIGERTTFDLERLVRSTWDSLETDEATLRLSAPITVEGDVGRLREVFENLFENALTHAGRDVTVRVGVEEQAAETVIFVADDGPGIPESRREDVFGWGHSTGAEGTGFGLAIVTQIVQAHGWTFDVRGAEDGGARFEITIPGE